MELDLGERLQNLRESKNMSREDLAKKMNVSILQLSHIQDILI
ncbi:helix-turn-helix domain-containing protein [Priestia filamentosa]|nr:helix-turn-helix domain-containing protein [Priestia filamentosa]